MTMTWQDVQTLRNVAFLQSQIACALITLEGMKAENALRALNGDSPAYDEKAFQQIIYDKGIGHNDVLTTLRNGL